MIFRETTQEDLDFVADHSVSRGVQKFCPDQTVFTYTLEHEGKPLGIGGYNLINVSTAWAWVNLTDESGKYIKTCYRVIKEWTDKFILEHKIKRLQVYVECDFIEAIRLARHLGFEKESVMKNFVGDKDAFLFVRII